MKKLLKIIMILIFLIILSIAGYYIYISYFVKQQINQAIKAVPEDSFVVIQTQDLFKAYDQITQSQLWQYLVKTDYFADINNDLQTLDKYLRATPLPQDFFRDRPMIFTINVVNGSWDYIAIIDLKDLGKIAPQLDIILTSVPDYKTFKLNYSPDKDHTYLIYKLVYLPNQFEKYYVSFVGNLVIISPQLSLLKKSLNALSSSSIADNSQFQHLLSQKRSTGLFSAIINFKQLDPFVRTFQNYRDPYIQTISQGLGYAILDLNIIDNKLSLKGIASIDTSNSYFKALSLSRPAILNIYQILSDQTAAMVALNFSDYTEFYQNFMQAFQKEEPRQAYEIEKSINVLRNISGIDIEKDIFSWIGNEIAVYKLSPEYGKRAEDIVITVHTPNPIDAKEKLDLLTKKISRISPLKFKEINYRGYTISLLKINGFFRMFFGRLFADIEKPYFTIMGNYVVFSNSPQTLEKVIDDYLAGYTLNANDKFIDFLDNFNRKNTFFAYINTPLLFKNLLFFTTEKDRRELIKNKDLITGFSQIALQLTAEKDLMKINIASIYDPHASLDIILHQMEKQTQVDRLLQDIDSMKFKIDLGDTVFNDGTRIVYYDNGQIFMQGEIKNGHPFGQWRIFYPDGNLKMTQMFDMDGKLNGLVQIFYDNSANSKLAEFYIKDDLVDGILIQYYENGQIKAKIEYHNGLRDGKATFYYSSGQIKAEGKYSNGKKHGKWKFYDKQGNLISTEVWKHGQRKR